MQEDEQVQKDGTQEEQQLEQVRQILLKQKLEQTKSEIQSESRAAVAQVLTEALHDRDSADGSVQKVLQPMVAKSVERSIKKQRQDFVDYLYPLVGSLVRKAVAVFFTDFIEKTNDIIENSFTFKGLKWRINAWRSGISFSEYVASQTFLFRVEQVLLIHKETGNLLHSLAASTTDTQDADLVSAMLGAINDFVADSFQSPTQESGEQHLGQIKTDDFTLFIRQAPQVILVAAVTGNMSRSGLEQLQFTLEEIQRIYFNELQSYAGDAKPFDSTSGLLQDCLLAEEKAEIDDKNKRPWYGWITLGILFLVLAWYLYGWWVTHQVVSKIEDLNPPPGIVIQSLSSSGRYQVELSSLRDPIAPETHTWLAENNINTDFIQLKEVVFLSVDKRVIAQKVTQTISDYPTLRFDIEAMTLGGELPISEFQSMTSKLNQIPGQKLLQIDTSQVVLLNNQIDLSQSQAVNEQLFVTLVGEISTVQITFESGESGLGEDQSANLDKVGELYLKVEALATRLNRSANLVIVGASDSTGESAYNQRLSRQRALVVREALIERGLKPEHVFSVGVGEIDLPGDIKSTRKVLFNVMFAELNN
ncbi:MAG: OmpA family protein [Glaciecola sp.]|jgi:outer membrane protein OmpA-like peptidoglycan-associated protein